MKMKDISSKLPRKLCVPLLAAVLISPGIAEEQSNWTVTNLGSKINSAVHEGFPAITNNGLALYFARGTTSVIDGVELEDCNIYVSTRSSLDASWGEPHRLWRSVACQV